MRYNKHMDDDLIAAVSCSCGWTLIKQPEQTDVEIIDALEDHIRIFHFDERTGKKINYVN